MRVRYKQLGGVSAEAEPVALLYRHIGRSENVLHRQTILGPTPQLEMRRIELRESHAVYDLLELEARQPIREELPDGLPDEVPVGFDDGPGLVRLRDDLLESPWEVPGELWARPSAAVKPSQQSYRPS